MTEAIEQISIADALRAAVVAVPIHPSALFTEVQVGKALNVSIRALAQGEGHCFVRHLGRAVRYRNNDLTTFIEARTVTSTRDPVPTLTPGILG